MGRAQECHGCSPVSYFYPKDRELEGAAAAAAAGKWPCVKKGLTEVLAVQPRAWTLIETEARDPSMSAPRLS